MTSLLPVFTGTRDNFQILQVANYTALICRFLSISLTKAYHSECEWKLMNRKNNVHHTKMCNAHCTSIESMNCGDRLVRSIIQNDTLKIYGGFYVRIRT